MPVYAKDKFVGTMGIAMNIEKIQEIVDSINYTKQTMHYLCRIKKIL
ncbi:hypothetical protein [Campylobacter pinnipediorum]|nr:hypothetical protein [Campylobacter pinnipediorum]